MNSESNYRRPFTFAIAFHLLLLMLFLFRFNFNDNSHNTSNEIIQATLVMPSAPAPAVNTAVPVPTPPTIEKTSPPEPEQKIITPTTSPIPPNSEEHVIQDPLPRPLEVPKEVKITLPKEIRKPPIPTKEEQIKKEIQKEIAAEKQQALQDEIQQQIEREQQQKKAQTLAKKHHHEIEQLLQQNLVESQPTKGSIQTKEKIATSTRSSSGANNKEIDHYKSLIISAISHQWIVPENLKTGLECHLKVRVAPGGVVMSVKLTKPSGDATLDHSAESAVYKASPLPVPKDGALFNNFREFNLIVRPEGILAG